MQNKTERHERHRVPAVECPVCGKELDAVVNIDKEGGKPNPNDVSVCAYCTAVLVFDDELKIRVATDAQMKELKETEPEAWDVIQKAIKHFSE